MGVNINFERRRQEEALRRRAYRVRAARLESLRGSFRDWMSERGYTPEQQAQGLEQLEEHVEYSDYMAEEGDVDRG